MKKIYKKTAIGLIFGLLFGISAITIAQPAPPPPGNHGMDGNQGGAAPIGSGLAILLTMGAAYGGKKIFDARKRLEE
jgi:hypothetical protein